MNPQFSHSRGRSAHNECETRYSRESSLLFFFFSFHFFFSTRDRSLPLRCCSRLHPRPLPVNSIAYNLVSRLHNNRLWPGSKRLFRVLTHHLLRIRPSTNFYACARARVRNMSIRLHARTSFTQGFYSKINIKIPKVF